MTPMGGWETCTAIIGVATVIGSTWASIHKHRRPPAPPIEAGLEGRIIKLEASMAHAEENTERLERQQEDARRRHEEVVDGIYNAINDLRKELMEYFKKGRA